MASLPTPPAEHQQPVNKLPASSTFSFKAPFPASSSSSSSTPASPLKHRRVSLALPSSPRVVQAWSFRDDTGIDSSSGGGSNLALPEKKGKMRKIAPTAEDEDPTTFQEKKPRKKWSAEETQMLVDGCNRHGVGNWKTILSDPTLKFDSRSPVDLKDRFRTYFPDAYKQHYPNARTHLSSKVRSTLPDGSPLFEKTRSKRRRPFTEEEDRALKAGYEKHGTVWATIVKDPVFQDQNRRSTDLRDRFRNAFPELYQLAGYKPRTAAKKKNGSFLGDGIGMGQKVPMRAATDDQLVMSTTGPVRSRRRAHTSQGLLRGGTKSVPQSTAVSEDEDSSGGEDESEASPAFKQPQIPVFVDDVSTVSFRTKKQLPSVVDVFTLDDDDEMEMVTIDQLSDPLTIPDFLPNQTHSEMETQSQQPWSSGINTPTHSHNAWSTTAGSPTSSHISADFLMNQNQNQNTSSHSSPFLQQRSSGNSNGNNLGMIGKSAWGNDWFSPNPRLDSSTSGSDVLSPASPFSFSHHLNHGVLDRYDLFPASMPHDFSSEVGIGDSHSTFSDEMFPPNGFRGFTHHSNYAGDLIFGARTHQPQSSSYYSSGFGFGLGFGGQGQGLGLGLGLSGMGQTAGIHPMQLHTPALPGIDEIELTGITLDDHADPLGVPLPPDAMDDDELDVSGLSSLSSSHSGLSSSLSSQSLPHTQQQQQQKDEPQEPSDRLCLDDIVDFSQELHLTPPATPLNHPRPMRRSSGSVLQHYPSANGGAAPHARSISVPPSEARGGANGNGNGRWRISPNGQPESSSSLGGGSVSMSELSPFFSSPAPSSTSSARSERALPLPDFRPLTPTNTQHSSHSQNSLLTTSASSPPSMSMHDSWRSNMFANGNNGNTVDLYDLPFLDLHYYGGSMGNNSINGNNTLGSFSGLTAAGMDIAGDSRQGQALDLAQSAVSKPRQQVSDPPPPPPPLSKESAVPVPTTSQCAPKQQGRSMSHHRGQSAVCPQDLMLRNDNKRKRASWDGGHG